MFSLILFIWGALHVWQFTFSFKPETDKTWRKYVLSNIGFLTIYISALVFSLFVEDNYRAAALAVMSILFHIIQQVVYLHTKTVRSAYNVTTYLTCTTVLSVVFVTLIQGIL